jgi:hypothetical protein
MNKTVQIFGDATIYDAQTKDYIKNTRSAQAMLAFDYSYRQINGNKNALSACYLKKN